MCRLRPVVFGQLNAMQIFKSALSMALFIVIASAMLLLWQMPGTAEFVVTVLSLLVGLIFLLIVIILIKKLSR